jgi:hypothetical protein
LAHAESVAEVALDFAAEDLALVVFALEPILPVLGHDALEEQTLIYKDVEGPFQTWATLILYSHHVF